MKSALAHSTLHLSLIFSLSGFPLLIYFAPSPKISYRPLDLVNNVFCKVSSFQSSCDGRRGALHLSSCPTFFAPCPSFRSYTHSTSLFLAVVQIPNKTNTEQSKIVIYIHKYYVYLISSRPIPLPPAKNISRSWVCLPAASLLKQENIS